MLNKKILDYLESIGIDVHIIKGVAFKVDAENGYSVHINIRKNRGVNSIPLKFGQDKKTAMAVYTDVGKYVEEQYNVYLSGLTDLSGLSGL